mgnify:CR=1 FL=1
MATKIRAQTSVHDVARVFGCTPEQARAQYLKCADVLDKMAEVAEQRGCKQRGFTAADLRARAADQRARALKAQP